MLLRILQVLFWLLLLRLVVRTLARAEVERRLSQEIPRILAETTLLPVSEQGRVTGFALTRLPREAYTEPSSMPT